VGDTVQRGKAVKAELGAYFVGGIHIVLQDIDENRPLTSTQNN
jgi:hypothetical protein